MVKYTVLHDDTGVYRWFADFPFGRVDSIDFPTMEEAEADAQRQIARSGAATFAAVNGKFYEGVAGDMDPAVIAHEGGRRRFIDWRNDLSNHSPDGLAWGYGGSGPAQCALAILADATGCDQVALRLHQRFKWAVIAKYRQGADWKLPAGEVIAWVRANPHVE